MPEWKPGYRHSIADGIQGLGLTVGLAWLFYDSFYAVLFLSPIIWFWHRERMAKEAKRDRTVPTDVSGMDLIAGFFFIRRIFCGERTWTVLSGASVDVSQRRIHAG